MKNHKEEFENMKEHTDDFLQQLDILKNSVYGYRMSLQLILPKDKPQVLDDINAIEYKKFNNFLNEIVRYYQQIYDEDGKETLKYVKELLIAIFTYLMINCNSDDYTMLGVQKILSTYINDPFEDIKDCIFFIMYQNEKNEGNYPKRSKKAFAFIFGHVFDEEDKEKNYFKISTIVENTRWILRYYLHLYKFDFLSDSIMMEATEELLEEISERLFNIYSNLRKR